MKKIARAHAKKIARKLAKGGTKYADISKHLAAEGYVGKRTGKPLTVGGVHALIAPTSDRRSVRRQNAPRAASSVSVSVPKPTSGIPDLRMMNETLRLKNLVRRVAGIENMPAEEKLALIVDLI